MNLAHRRIERTQKQKLVYFCLRNRLHSGMIRSPHFILHVQIRKETRDAIVNSCGINRGESNSWPDGLREGSHMGRIDGWATASGACHESGPGGALAGRACRASYGTRSGTDSGRGHCEVSGACVPQRFPDLAISKLTELNEGLEQVTEIDATGSQVTSAAFSSIEKLTSLQQLRLTATRVNNDACEKIALLSSLEILSLTDTAVTDVGIAQRCPACQI